jgi:hypothetical protein
VEKTERVEGGGEGEERTGGSSREHSSTYTNCLTRAASTPPQPPWPEPGEAPETRARQEKEPGSSGLGLSLSIMSWLDNVKMETGSAPTNAPGRRKAGRELQRASTPGICGLQPGDSAGGRAAAQVAEPSDFLFPPPSSSMYKNKPCKVEALKAS